MVTIPKPGTPLVTLEEVDAWREEMRALKAQQEEIGSKIGSLEARLTAADFFIRERAAHKVPVLNTPTFAPEIKLSNPPTMYEAILRIIRKSPNGVEPKQISSAIRTDPDLPLKIKNSHPNYLYTVLMRLAHHGLVRKEGSLYKPIAAAKDALL